MIKSLTLLLSTMSLLCGTVVAKPAVSEAISVAESFSYDTLGRLVRNQSISVDWLDGDRYFHYSIEDSTGVRHHYIVDTRSWKKKELFDPFSLPVRIAEKINGEGCPDKSGCLPDLSYIQVDGADPHVFTFRHLGRRFSYDSSKDFLEEVRDPEGTALPEHNDKWYRSYSADSLFCISASGHNLVLYGPGERDSLVLTHDGEQYHSFAVGGDSPKDSRDLSSPSGIWVGDSHRFFIVREDKRQVGTLTLVNSLAKPRPVAKTYKFPMPGDRHVTQYDAWLVDADARTITRLDIDAYPDQKIVVPRFNNFPRTDRYVYFIRMNRPSDIVELCRADAADGSVDVLIHEECKPHLNEQLFSFHVLNDGKDILWWSERTGKGMYYLYDGEGNLRNSVTPGEDFVSGKIVRIDTLSREIIFEGYGREAGVNPYYTFYYKASMDGRSTPVCLTPGNGTHSIRFSDGGRFIVDDMSRMDLAPRHRIFDMKGRERFRMEDADLSALYRRGWKEPLVMKVHAADSVTSLYGVVYLPFGLDTTKKYPIISSVYPGPQIDLVPTAFFVDDNYNQSLAQLGFVVVNFAYRGSSPYRGRDFYAYGYGNLRDYPLDDDYSVIRQIGEMLPYADTTRVGIYGHSGGGFMTATAMMTRPDFYKAGVAASGNYDNNIYTQWWGETFHGVSERKSQDGTVEFVCDVPGTCELAGNLKGNLLLITGDMDNNVHPASTIRLADALIKAGKHFDMMIIPGADHGLGDKYYVNLIRLYFAEHLLGMDTDYINNN